MNKISFLRPCVICTMPTGLEPDRALLMGIALARRYPAVELGAFEVATAMCTEHANILRQLAAPPPGRRG